MALWYPCCGGLCPWCSGNTPHQVEVTFAGVADDNCADCDEYWNDAFVLTQDPLENFECYYNYFDSSVYCFNPLAQPMAVQLVYSHDGGGNARISVTVTYDFNIIIFRKDYVAPVLPVCVPAGPIDIPLFSTTYNAPPVHCSWSPGGVDATCSLDAAP